MKSICVIKRYFIIIFINKGKGLFKYTSTLANFGMIVKQGLNGLF